jgi:hypothetical protein
MATNGVHPGDALPTQVLHPVLDTYLNAAVGIVGCHGYGVARSCCEYDVVVVSGEKVQNSSVKSGDSFMDLYFVSEKDVLGPSDPELAVSLSFAKPVRDNSLIFSTGSSAAKAVLHENLRKAAEGRLAKSLKALGRADEAVSKGLAGDADYWLLSSAYEFALAWLFSSGTPPSPSHILEQLKARSSDSPGRYEVFSGAVGLERASRASSAERLDALSVLYDAVGTSRAGEGEERGATSTRTSFDIVKSKAEFLTASMMNVDCYAFLGMEVCAILSVVSSGWSEVLGAQLDQSQIVTSLSVGDRRMIGERVVRGMGLTRDVRTIDGRIEGLRAEISSLAKSI